MTSKYVKHATLVLILVAAIMFPFYSGVYLRQVAISILIYMSLALSWDMLLRSGQLSFGISGFFGLGAYVSALLCLRKGVPPLVAIVSGGMFALVVASLLGLAVLRLRGMYFAIVTLALATVFMVLAKNIPSLTGGVAGRMLPRVIFGGDSAKAYWLTLGLALGVAVLSEFFQRTQFFYALTSIRDNELVARSSGVDVFRYLLITFAIVSAVQGIIGGAYAQIYGFVAPEETFSLTFLLLPMAMALLGGIYTTSGPILGALLLGALGELFKLHFPYGHRLIYGIMIIGVMLLMPRGIAGTIRSLRWQMSKGDMK